MLKLIALNYNVMLNDYSQWLNINGKNNFIETSVVLISAMHKTIRKKMPSNKYKNYIVFMLFIYCKYIVIVCVCGIFMTYDFFFICLLLRTLEQPRYSPRK